jgi:hypothetical protein
MKIFYYKHKRNDLGIDKNPLYVIV